MVLDPLDAEISSRSQANAAQGVHVVPSTGHSVKVEASRDEDAIMESAPRFVPEAEGYPRRARLDGVSALLRAGEMVDKHECTK